MAVRIRLKRYGRCKRPYYRLTAVDRRSTRDGRVIEELGLYDPINPNPERQVVLNRERIEYWLGVGASPTDTVVGLLKRGGIAKG